MDIKRLGDNEQILAVAPGKGAGRIMIKTMDLSYKLDIESFVDIAELRSHLKSIFTHRYKER